MRDWYGLANSILMTISVLVRFTLNSWYRYILDRNTIKAEPDIEDQQSSQRKVKLYVTTPFGDAVNIETTRDITTQTLLTTPRPQKPDSHLLHWLHDAIRAVGWFAYGGHVVVLGMTTLANQIIVIFILISTTIILVSRIDGGTSNVRIGTELQITAQTPGKSRSHKELFILLNLTRDQENTFISWTLMPPRFNAHWWDGYESEKSQMSIPKAATIFRDAATRSGDAALKFNTIAGILQIAANNPLGTAVDPQRVLDPLQQAPDIFVQTMLRELVPIEIANRLKSTAIYLERVAEIIQNTEKFLGTYTNPGRIACDLRQGVDKVPWIVPFATKHKAPTIVDIATSSRDAAIKFQEVATNLRNLQESLEQERLEQERLEQERLEQERLEQERLERLERERLERERLEQERLERLERERLERERLEQERLEQERLEQERLEQERLQESFAQKLREQEKIDQEKQEQRKREQEQKNREQEQEKREQTGGKERGSDERGENKGGGNKRRQSS
jgi:flagellar biosynthesis GTPase FlhF